MKNKMCYTFEYLDAYIFVFVYSIYSDKIMIKTRMKKITDDVFNLNGILIWMKYVRNMCFSFVLLFKKVWLIVKLSNLHTQIVN